MRRKMAWIISRVFDPVVEIPLILTATVWLALSNGLRWRFLIFILIVDVLLPAGYLLLGLKRGWLSDWDVTKRRERQGLFFFTVIMHLITVVYAFFLGKLVLATILAIFWSLALVFALITTKWKISVHAGVNAAALAFFAHFWGWDNYWWLVIVLLLVLWSRVKVNKHDWLQVSLGAVLAIVWVELGLVLLL